MRYVMLAVLLSLSVSARCEDAAKPVQAPAPESAAAVAVAKISSGLRMWFQHVKEGLAESSVAGQRQHSARFNAVAAVRGADQTSADPMAPIWKSAAAGKSSRALRIQRGELTSAVDSILDGKLDDGQQKLDAFEKKHVGSPMIADAHDVRAKLTEAQAETVAASPAAPLPVKP
jgi:hypothetical protein